MTASLIGLLLAAFAPLIIARSSATLCALVAQGLILAALAMRGHHVAGPAGLLAFADLALVRAAAAPLILYRGLKMPRLERAGDLIPPNLFSWTVSLATIPIAFGLAESLVPEAGYRQLLAAATTALVLQGFLILSTASAPVHQMIGVLYVENAVALLEIGAGHRPELVAIQAGQLVLDVVTLALFRWYLEFLARAPELEEAA